MSDAMKLELEQLLAQAASFERSGDYTGALARVQWAREQFQQRGVPRPHPDAAVEELLRSADLSVDHYRQLLEKWQEENARRHEAYVNREQSAIRTFGREDDGDSERGGTHAVREPGMIRMNLFA
jgi:hypothetical protein